MHWTFWDGPNEFALVHQTELEPKHEPIELHTVSEALTALRPALGNVGFMMDLRGWLAGAPSGWSSSSRISDQEALRRCATALIGGQLVLARVSRGWWNKQGFAKQPKPFVARGDEVVCQVSGGSSGEPGAYFSLESAASVSQTDVGAKPGARGTMPNFEARFRIKSGVQFWVGPAAQNSTSPTNQNAPRVHIPAPTGKIVRLEKTAAKPDVVTGTDGNAKH